jgi:predicted acyl esterase
MDSDPEFVEFTYTFTEPCTLIGPSKAVLFTSCPDHDDMDIFVIIRKADKDGKILRNVNIPLEELGLTTAAEVEDLNTLKYIGPSGILRASHRAIDPKLSKPHWVAHDHTREDKVPPGTVVRMEIGIWAAAIHFEAGEKLVFRVAGHQMTLAEFVPLRGGFQAANKGTHTLHYGGEYESYLTVPSVHLL